MAQRKQAKPCGDSAVEKDIHTHTHNMVGGGFLLACDDFGENNRPFIPRLHCFLFFLFCLLLLLFLMEISSHALIPLFMSGHCGRHLYPLLAQTRGWILGSLWQNRSVTADTFTHELEVGSSYCSVRSFTLVTLTKWLWGSHPDIHRPGPSETIPFKSIPSQCTPYRSVSLKTISSESTIPTFPQNLLSLSHTHSAPSQAESHSKHVRTLSLSLSLSLSLFLSLSLPLPCYFHKLFTQIHNHRSLIFTWTLIWNH